MELLKLYIISIYDEKYQFIECSAYDKSSVKFIIQLYNYIIINV